MTTFTAFIFNFKFSPFILRRHRLHHPSAIRLSVPRNLSVHMFPPQTPGAMIGIPVSFYRLPAILTLKILPNSFKIFHKFLITLLSPLRF